MYSQGTFAENEDIYGGRTGAVVAFSTTEVSVPRGKSRFQNNSAMRAEPGKAASRVECTTADVQKTEKQLARVEKLMQRYRQKMERQRGVASGEVPQNGKGGLALLKLRQRLMTERNLAGAAHLTPNGVTRVSSSGHRDIMAAFLAKHSNQSAVEGVAPPTGGLQGSDSVFEGNASALSLDDQKTGSVLLHELLQRHRDQVAKLKEEARQRRL